MTARQLPVELQRELHAALRIRLGAPEAEVRVLNRRSITQGTKLSTVQEIERLPSEVEAVVFATKIDAPGQREVLVESRPVAQLGIVPGLVAERGGRLRAKEGC